MRWSPQMSRMVLLLTSQLRPLSYRLQSLHFLYRPSEKAVSLTAVRLTSTYVETAWQRMSSNVIAMRQGSIGKADRTISIGPKKRRT